MQLFRLDVDNYNINNFSVKNNQLLYNNSEFYLELCPGKLVVSEDKCSIIFKKDKFFKYYQLLCIINNSVKKYFEINKNIINKEKYIEVVVQFYEKTLCFNRDKEQINIQDVKSGDIIIPIIFTQDITNNNFNWLINQLVKCN